MTSVQAELFPQAVADRAQAVLNYLTTRKDKVEKALATAEQNLEDIESMITKQQHVIRLLREHSVTQATVDAEILDADLEPQEEPEEAEVLAIDGVVVTEDGTGYVNLQIPSGGVAGMMQTTVGPRTRYSQLVAAYLTEAGLDHDVYEYEVIGPIEKHDDEEVGAVCDLRAEIPRCGWWQTFRLVHKAAEQACDPEAEHAVEHGVSAVGY